MINITRFSATSIHHDHEHKALTYMGANTNKKYSTYLFMYGM